MASPIPATAYQGLEANYWSFGPFRPPQVIKMLTKRTQMREQFMSSQCWGESWCLLGELEGPKRHQMPKSTKNSWKSEKLSIHRNPI